MTLDWAEIDCHFRDWLGVRAGKIETLLGLFNDSQDQEFLYTWALLPQGVYPLDLRELTNANTGGDGRLTETHSEPSRLDAEYRAAKRLTRILQVAAKRADLARMVCGGSPTVPRGMSRGASQPVSIQAGVQLSPVDRPWIQHSGGISRSKATGSPKIRSGR